MKTLDKKIEVIATFPEKGLPIPNRMRFRNDNEDEPIVIQISKILFNEIQSGIDRKKFILYRCRSVVDNRTIDFEIKFMLMDTTWYLHKM